MDLNIKPITIIDGEVINEDVFGDIGNNFTKVKTAVDGVVDDVNNLLSGGTIKNELEIVVAKADKNITDLNSQFTKVDINKKELDVLSANAKESQSILEPLVKNANAITNQLTDVNAEANILNTDLVKKNDTAQTTKNELRSEIDNADEKLQEFKNYDTTELVPKANTMLNDMYCDRELMSINHKLNGYPTVKLTYVEYGAGMGGVGDYPAGGDSECNLMQNKTIYKDENNLTVYVPSNYYFGTPSIEPLSNYQYAVTFTDSTKSILIDLIDRNVEQDIATLYDSVDIKSDNIDNTRATLAKSVTGAINELHSGLGKISTQLSQMENNITNEINIKMYGVVGDGLTDDTVNLQKAINDSFLNNIKLVSDANKIYIISKQLSIVPTKGVKNGIILDFNFSTIKASTKIESIIKVDMKEYGEYEELIRGCMVKIRNITLDSNNMSTYGLYSYYSEGLDIKDIRIINVNMVGIYCNKGTILLDRFVITGDDSITTKGLLIECGDSIFTRGNINKCHVCIHSKYGALNIYNDIHGWCGANFESSTFLINEGIGSDIESASFILNNIYADSYQYIIHQKSKSPVAINNLILYYNKYLYTDTSLTPYIVYLDNSDGYLNNLSDYVEASMSVLINNGILFKNPNVDTFYTNISKKYVKNTNGNILRYLADKDSFNMGTLVLNNNYTPLEGWKNSNNYYYNNGVVNLNFAVSTTDGMQGGNNYLIGTISDWYMQSEYTIHGFCSVIGNNTEVVTCFLNGDDGKLYITIPSSISEIKTKVKGSLSFRARTSPLTI